MLVLLQVDGAADVGAVEVAGGAQPQIGEDLQHLVILCERFGGEAGDARLPGSVDQVFEQQGAYAVAVAALGDGHGDVRGHRLARGCGQHGVLGHPDHPAVGQGDERTVATVSRCADALRRLLCVARVDGEEAQPHGLGRHLLMHAQYFVPVLWSRGAYLNGAAVGEQGVDRIGTVCGVRHPCPLASAVSVSGAGPWPGARSEAAWSGTKVCRSLGGRR